MGGFSVATPLCLVGGRKYLRLKKLHRTITALHRTVTGLDAEHLATAFLALKPFA